MNDKSDSIFPVALCQIISGQTFKMAHLLRIKYDAPSWSTPKTSEKMCFSEVCRNGRKKTFPGNRLKKKC